MSCPSCGDCGRYMRNLVRLWYPPTSRPRRPHEEVVLERAERARAVAARREFNKRKRAEREAKKKEDIEDGKRIVSEVGSGAVDVAVHLRLRAGVVRDRGRDLGGRK